MGSDFQTDFTKMLDKVLTGKASTRWAGKLTDLVEQYVTRSNKQVLAIRKLLTDAKMNEAVINQQSINLKAWLDWYYASWITRLLRRPPAIGVGEIIRGGQHAKGTGATIGAAVISGGVMGKSPGGGEKPDDPGTGG